MDIVRHGTSAYRQIATYAQVTDGGGSPEDALKAVVDLLIEETAAGL